MIARVVLALLLMPAGALAQHNGHAENHDWYRLLKRGTYSCCNGDQPGNMGDCRPVHAAPQKDGTWRVFIGGQWIDVPPDTILPDELNKVPLHAHVCEQDGYIRCFLKGGGGT